MNTQIKVEYQIRDELINPNWDKIIDNIPSQIIAQVHGQIRYMAVNRLPGIIIAQLSLEKKGMSS